MKTIQSFFCASALLCAALPASAAWPTQAIFDPEDGIVSATQTISVKFSCDEGDLESPMYVMAFMVGGNGFGQDPTIHELVVKGGEVSFDLTEADWGYPYNEEYSVYVGLVVCKDADYTPYETEDGDMLAFETTYQRPVEGASKCMLQYPNEWNWTQEDLKFNDFYEGGYGALYFSKPIVQPEGVIGSIIYYLQDGGIEETDITSYEYSVDVDPLSGMWTLSFNVVDERFSAADIESMEINFIQFKSKNDKGEIFNVDVEPMEIINNSPATPKQKAVKKQKESGLTLGVSTDTVTVYNLQGMVVLENATASSINNLPAGLYIINGKKVAIR